EQGPYLVIPLGRRRRRWGAFSAISAAVAGSMNLRAVDSPPGGDGRGAYAVRKPREYRPLRPGDLVEIDTLDLRPIPGVTLTQSSARVPIWRWAAPEVRGRATASIAADFLATVQHRMPVPVPAIQVDGGSEFYAVFEDACRLAGASSSSCCRPK